MKEMNTYSERTTTVVTSQPVSGTIFVQQGTREWSSGLFSCFDDISSCLCGWFCTMCTLCRIAKAQNEHCCAPCCCIGAALAMRTKLRTEYGIEGSICGDGLRLYCLGPCTVCQMEREMKQMGRM